MPFYDFDENLDFTNNKNNIQTYFSDSNFKKYDGIIMNTSFKDTNKKLKSKIIRIIKIINNKLIK